MAESTFGRRAVNDGKFVSRLRDGARITPETLERVSEFLNSQGVEAPAAPPELMQLMRVRQHPRAAGSLRQCRRTRPRATSASSTTARNTCCSSTPAREGDGRAPRRHGARPPSSRAAGGQGVRRRHGRRHRADPGHARDAPKAADAALLHRRQGDQPGGRAAQPRKDGRPLPRAPGDRPRRHQHVLYRGAVADAQCRSRPPPRWSWHEVALTGNTAAEFCEQIEALEPLLAKVWQATHSPKTGNPVYERPVALVIYRDDFRFLLDDVIPRAGPRAGRLRPRDRLAALSRAGARRVQGRQGDRAADARAAARRPAARHPFLRPRSGPRDRAQDVAGRGPFKTSRHDILRAVRAVLGRDTRHYNFNAYADQRAVFRYDMHTLPTEIADSIGTSTLFAAWNAADLRRPDRRRAAGRGGRRPQVPRCHARGAAGAWAALVPR